MEVERLEVLEARVVVATATVIVIVEATLILIKTLLLPNQGREEGQSNIDLRIKRAIKLFMEESFLGTSL